MKLKTFANIMFALFITITTSYSQTGVWLVQEGNRLYYDSAQDKGVRDTLAYFKQLPAVAPIVAKTAVEDGSAPVSITSRREFLSFGFKYRDGVDITRVAYEGASLTDPVDTFVAEEPKWNYRYIIALPVYFIALWMLLWVGGRAERELGDTTATTVISLMITFVLLVSSGVLVAAVLASMSFENMTTPLWLVILASCVVVAHSTWYNFRKNKKNKIGYSSLYRNPMN
ncbi:hypothetical protein KA013_02095 [Patescibacteria group bacterium]|nr:hypothetical protein [Patescibacteria group bacterium]